MKSDVSPNVVIGPPPFRSDRVHAIGSPVRITEDVEPGSVGAHRRVVADVGVATIPRAKGFPAKLVPFAMLPCTVNTCRVAGDVTLNDILS